MLILDEPTSGVDPIARDRFWELLIELSRNQGVTIFVSTHFMNEAARCDRIALMDAGRVLKTGTPAELIAARGAATLEDAFISYLKEAEAARAPDAEIIDDTAKALTAPQIQAGEEPSPIFSFRRLFAYSIREALELRRDPIRLSFAVLGTAFLMLIFGFGITTDVNNLSFRVLDRDNTPESRAYLEEIRGSPYFTEKAPLKNAEEQQRALKTGAVNATIEIPPGFGRDLRAGRGTEVGVWVDGAMPFRAETMRQYLTGVHQSYLDDPLLTGYPKEKSYATTEVRFRYNQSFDSIYAQVPGTMALELALIPAILMALAVVREKELGTITNLYVTPVTRLEFLIGKQLPYIALAFWNFVLMAIMAWLIFHVPLKGSLLALATGALIYVDRHHRLRHVHLVFHPDADRSPFRHGYPDCSPGHAILRDDGAGLVAEGLSGLHGTYLSHDLFRADLRRHLHEGPGLFRPHRPFGLARRLRAGASSLEPAFPPQAGTVSEADPMHALSNIFWLGLKELRSFLNDYVLLGLVIYTFTLAVMSQAQSNSQELRNASIAIVDEDSSALSRQIASGFLPPYFKKPVTIQEGDIDRLMNLGRFTFVLDIPPYFERDVRAAPEARGSASGRCDSNGSSGNWIGLRVPNHKG